jgi:hypothetical protein
MNAQFNLRCIFAFILLSASVVHAQEKLLVQVPAVYDTNVVGGHKIKAECGLENLLGNHVYERVSQKFPGSLQVKDSDPAGSDKVLRLTILSVHGVGGGSWSGPKSMTIRADLAQNGKVVQSTVKSRSSRGGPFGGFKGTCDIFERNVQTLAKDVALWLGRTPPVSEVPVQQAPTEPLPIEKTAD